MKTIPLDASIVNLFQQGLSWDIFVQGFIFLFALTFSILFLLYLTQKSGDESFIEFVVDMYKVLFLNFFSNSTVVRDNEEKNSVTNSISNNQDTTKSEFKEIPNSYILQSFRLVSLTTTLIVISYIMGAMVINLSDKFMDKSNRYHLGLKKLWVNPDYYQKIAISNESKDTTLHCTTIKEYRNEIEATDKQIKLKVFDNILGKYLVNEIQGLQDKVFIKDSLACKHPCICKFHQGNCHYLKKTLSTIEPREKIKIYFFSKNATLSNPKWASYLSYSQILVNINQTLCFSFWILLIAAIMGFLTTVAITTKELLFATKNQNENEFMFLLYISYGIIILLTINFIADTNLPFNTDYTLPILLSIIFITVFSIQMSNIRTKKRLKTSLIITLLSTVMYLFSANAWQELERESCDKTYGLFEFHALEKGDKKVGEYIKSILNEDRSNLHLTNVEKQ